MYDVDKFVKELEAQNGSQPEFIQAVKEVVVDMEKSGEELPQPYSCRNFSGKFQVRIPPETHRNLVVQAADSGVSLNRYVSQKLA